MRIGANTVLLDKNVEIISSAAVVGPLEGTGALKRYFDVVLDDDKLEQKSYEKAESILHLTVLQNACKKLGITPAELDVMIGADLQNQIVSSTHAARRIDTAFLGVYAACASFGEGLIVGATMATAYGYSHVSVTTTSHYSTAERQYRFPLELGTQTTPTSHRTVTAGGCVILGFGGQISTPKICAFTLGRVIDMGIKNANNMGAVMAAAAADVIVQHLADTARTVEYYDAIITGDLGVFGSELLLKLTTEKGIDLKNRHHDCGVLMWEGDDSKDMGGSGAGCVSSVFSSYVMKKFSEGVYHKVLLVPTGALLSKDSPLQGETLPSIAYAVDIEV